MTRTDPDLIGRCRGIELLVLDVDGVLTDGVIAVDDRGVETKHFHVRDGSAIALWRRSGGRSAILSGRSAACVEVRARELGIAPVVQGAPEKLGALRSMLAELGVPADRACFVGDDLADLGAMGAVGLAACPSDAAPEVRGMAHLVASAPGGRGAVREVVERLLRARGAWDGLVAGFAAPATA